MSEKKYLSSSCCLDSLTSHYGKKCLLTETWNSQRGLSGEKAIPIASKMDGITAIPNIVLHLIKYNHKRKI
jgi:hypothetical protein